MPQLETLKKQAKQVVRWRRDGVWTVAERIRNSLPKFAGLTDKAILDHDFTLAEAQELIAREQGFDTWAALRANLARSPPQPKRTVAEPLRLGPAEPTLFVADIEATCRFFEDRLGFSTVFTYGQPPFYGLVQRDEARIAVRRSDRPVFAGDVRERQALLSVSIGVQNLKALYAEHRAAGVAFFQELKRHPWGAQDFVVVDPDGNLISFGFNPNPPG